MHTATLRSNKKLESKFQDLWGVSSVGPLRWYLWMEIEYVKGHHAFISQSAYFKKVLKRFGFDKMKGISTPMESTFKVTIDDAGEPLGADDKRRYMEIVG